MTTATAELTSLQLQRSLVKRKMLNAKQLITSSGGTLSEVVLQCRLQMFDSQFKQISHIQMKIEELDRTDAVGNDIDELYISTKSAMIELLKKKQPNFDETNVLTSTANFSCHSSKLPTLQLPRFDGKYSEYKRFRATFDNLVHNDPSLSTIDKFNYLLNCLSGAALHVVESFQISDENYPKALDRLKERFDNKVLIFLDNIKALFSVQAMSKGNASELRQLLDTVSALRGALFSLGSESDVMNAILIHIVMEKLDFEAKNHYEHSQDFKTLPSWDNCYKTLSFHCQYLERSSRTNKAEGTPHRSQVSKTKTFINAQSKCLKCKNLDHLLSACPSFIGLSVDERSAFVKRSALCFNCLGAGHTVTTCNSRYKCRECHRPHHTMLHKPTPVGGNSNISEIPTASVGTSSSGPSLPVSLLARSHKRTLLPTAIVLVQDASGQYVPARALLDSCSEISFITEHFAKCLKLPFTRSGQSVAGISNIQTQIKHSVFATFKSQVNSFSWTSNLSIIKSISSDVPNRPINIASWNIPPNITLADPGFHKHQHVDLLLGASVFFEILTAQKLTLGEGMPHLMNTKLGWIVAGQMIDSKSTTSVICNFSRNVQDLYRTKPPQRCWKLEEPPLSSSQLIDEIDCERHFVKNTCFMKKGRVQVRLPFKRVVNQLGHSVQSPQPRFLSSEKRLQPTSDIRVGVLVVVQEDNRPPLQWVLGRIVKSFPGRDRMSRIAEIQTSRGLIRRSIHKLVPLPVQEEF